MNNLARRTLALSLAEAFSRSRASDFDNSFRFPEVNSIIANGTNLYEVDNQYVLQIPLSAVNPDEVDITVNGRQLNVRAISRIPVPERARTIWTSSSETQYVESVTLPSEIYSDESQAKYKDGVLEIWMPKSEKTHKISVNK